MLFGIGYDIHRLVEDRKLVLGGVPFEYHLGLLGHSDADVVLHAISDALLGASALGDIGEHFPDTDPAWKDVPSDVILIKTLEFIKEKHYSINNVDVIIFAQEPKIGSGKLKIKQRLSDLLNVSKSRINIKAKTTEGLDAVGRGEAIAAQAVVSLCEKETNI
jgi:2-C-methyl-D-erythritol 2,4-cyclodiphosphate synthase